MPAVALTGERAGKVAGGIREVLGSYGAEVRGTVLESALVELDWLAGFPGEFFGPGGPYELDKNRAIEAFVVVLRLTYVLHAFQQVKSLSGFAGKAKNLRHLRPTLVSPHGTSKGVDRDREAWDILVEVEVAGLLSAGGVPVDLGEPDVRVLLPGERPFGLACKRPQNMKGVGRAIRDGVEQLERQSGRGVVLLNCDQVLAGSRGFSPVLHGGSSERVRQECDVKLDKIGEVAAERIAIGLGGSTACAGVVLVANFITLAPHEREGMSYVDSKMRISLVPCLESGTLLLVFESILNKGQAVFRSSPI